MRTTLASISLVFILNSTIHAQQIATDSLDLGEDQSSHSYQQFGSVALGSYICIDDSTIRVGNGNSGDSIIFELSVTPGSDSVKLEMAMPWRGGDESPLLWIENFMSDTIPFVGQADCTPVFINFQGLAAYTGDGSVKIKIMDTLGSFNMDGQISYIKIYSDTISSSVGISNEPGDDQLMVYPNPGNGLFTIKTKKQVKDPYYEIIDIHGKNIRSGFLEATKTIIDLSPFSKGVYLIRTGGSCRKIIIN
jgi:hypothetical protein